MTKSPINMFVCNLATERKVEIFHDYEAYEMTGVTGETALRIETVRHMKEQGIPENYIISFMNMMAFEICREFAKEYIRDNGLDNT
jgi:hypothetical protein